MIEDQVRGIVAAQLKRDVAEITLETDLAEAGYESLDVIETVFALEETFDVTIDYNANEAQAAEMTTVADVVAMVKAALAKRDAR